MIYLLFAINAIVAALPMRISLLGRALAVLNVLDIYLFASAANGLEMPKVLGILIGKLRPDLTVFGPDIATATMMTAVALVAAFSNIRLVKRLRVSAATVKIPTWLSALLLLIVVITGLFSVISVGPSAFLSYQGYGSIKAGETTGPIARLLGTVFRFGLILIIPIAILRFNAKGYFFAFAASLVIVVGLLIGLAEASRIVAVYCGAAIATFIVTRQYGMITLTAAFTFLSVLYSLEARTHTSLGLAYIPEYTAKALTGSSPVDQVIANTNSSLILESISVQAGRPEKYELQYKIASFFPTINAIDNFQEVKEVNEQRIHRYYPFSSFAEAYLFGPEFFILFWAILLYSAYSANALARRGVALYLVAVCAFLIGWVFAGQYPIRNGLRFFYAVIVLRLTLAFVRPRLSRRPIGAHSRGLKPSHPIDLGPAP